MPDISNIVNVDVRVTSAGLGARGFARVLILGTHARFVERFRIYQALDAMIADGFVESDPEYKAAATAFAGTNDTPLDVMIGRRAPAGQVAQVWTVTITSAVVGFKYTVALGLEVLEYTAPSGATVTTIRDALLALIQAAGWPLVAASNSTDAITLTLEGGRAHDVTVSANASVAETTPPVAATETVSAALTAIKGAGAVFFGVALTGNIWTDVDSLVGWTASNGDYFPVYDTDDLDVVDIGNTTDNASDYKNASYDIFGLWGAFPWERPALSLAAQRLAVDPDVSATTWELMILPGCRPTPDNILTSTRIAALEAKNVAYYAEFGDARAVVNSKVARGEWADVVVGIVWLKSRLQEATFNAIQAATLRGSKLAFTNADGRGVLENVARAQLQRAIDTGFLASYAPGTLPDFDTLAPAVRATRRAPALVFNGRIAGAVHKADFQINLTA